MVATATATAIADCLFVLRLAAVGVEPRPLPFIEGSASGRRQSGAALFDISALDAGLVEWRPLILPDGRRAGVLRRRLGQARASSNPDPDLVARFARWPDVLDDGLAVMQGEGEWLLSLAPASSIDIYLTRTADGSLLVSDGLAPLLDERVRTAAFDLAALAERFSGSVTVENRQTLHPEILQMASGLELRADEGELSWRRWWDPAAISIQIRPSLDPVAEQLRARAEALVDAFLPESGPVAVQLSGGRDSSLLCGLAARRLASQNRSLLALTALPCEGYPQANSLYQYDESAGAIATASRYGNVEHHLLRPAAVPLASILDALHRHLANPIHQPVPLSWSVPQLKLCAERGVGTLLTGDLGNFTVSAGGLVNLVDIQREEGGRTWLHACVGLLGEGVGVRDLVRVSLGASMPLFLYKAGRKRGRPQPLFNHYPYFKGALRQQLIELTPDNDDPRPLAAYRPLIQEVAANSFNLFPIGRAMYGVELLSPWKDRSLFELVLSLPSSLLTSPPERRALFDRAFGDLLPREVLRPARRGRQNVDFHAAIDPLDLQAGLERYRHSALCREYVEVERLEAALRNWPCERNTDIQHYGFWITQFLPAFALASFLYTREHSAPGSSAATAERLHAAP